MNRPGRGGRSREPKGEKVQLSVLQLAVMRVLWQGGEAATAEVATALSKERGLAHTTIGTLLTRLEKRGLVEAHKAGRALVYRPLVSEDEVRTSMVSTLLASLFRGDAQALVAHLVREDEIGPKDLEQLRARLREGRK